MPQVITSLPIGSKIKLGKIYGQDIVWIVGEFNRANMPSGSVTLVTEKAIKYAFFDAAENVSGYAYGFNNYRYSNLNQWLNATGGAGAWYSTPSGWPQDQPPTGVYAYDDDPGFLNGFSELERASIMTTTVRWNELNGSGQMQALVFLPDQYELSGGTSSLAACIADANLRKSYMMDAAVADSGTSIDNTKTSAIWTRRQEAETNYRVFTHYINDSGTESTPTSQCNQGKAVRPMINIRNTVQVSDTPDANGAYSVIYNAAPTAPGSITVAGVINGGTTTTVSWTAGADTDGNLAGYILERSVAGGAWGQVYKGALRSFTDSIVLGWASVAYRVKSYDAYDAESAYTTSATRTVNNNTSPTISGTDGNLGSYSTAFTAQSYTVNDAQGGTVTVVERLDGVVKRTFSATLGGSNSFSFTTAEWRQVLNGVHTITITATDSQGLATVRTWTFTKAVNTLTFTITPLPADAMPDRCVVDAAGNFPTGSTLKIEVCNNANDASPRWEDVSAKLGEKHFFTNASKTASAWAFGLRCTLTRGTATGAVWLDYITINYR